MEPMRVAIVAASPRWIGGQGVQADLLVRHWFNDSDVAVRFIPIDTVMPGWVRCVERIPALRTLVRAPFYLAALLRGTADVDIVHIFSASYSSFLLASLPAWLIARIHGKKTLFHYHSGEARDHLRRSGLAKLVLKQADGIVVPSTYLVNVFQDFDLHVRVLPNVVDASQFSYRSRLPVAPKLVCTRGFHPYYSVDLVVRAFDLLKRTCPESRLCLVGKGPVERQIRDLVETLKLRDVKFTGLVSHSEIHHYYDENDIFINASWLDNMPVSILEAFASGTPVVTTAAGGIRYLVEHERTGLLCDPWDWKALAKNVIRLILDPRLALRIAQNAHEESQRCSWDVVRGKWLELYRSVLPVSNC
jgi:glycosyltransferase involved in cell wall biosynthesis